MAYRASRNIEASIIDKISTQLVTDSWTGVTVIKSFKEAYKDNNIPCICVNVVNVDPKKLEIGSKTHIKYYLVNFKIFATSDGQRLDLADWLFDLLEDDVDYYTYTITNGAVSSKVLTGRIAITEIVDNKKELENTENLVKEDRYRHLIAVRCYVA